MAKFVVLLFVVRNRVYVFLAVVMNSGIVGSHLHLANCGCMWGGKVESHILPKKTMLGGLFLSRSFFMQPRAWRSVCC